MGQWRKNALHQSNINHNVGSSETNQTLNIRVLAFKTASPKMITFWSTLVSNLSLGKGVGWGLEIEYNNQWPMIQSGFPGSAVVKNLPANAGDGRDVGLIPTTGRSPGEGNGNPLQYSCLKISWTEEPGGLNRTWLSNWAHTYNGTINHTPIKIKLMNQAWRVSGLVSILMCQGVVLPQGHPHSLMHLFHLTVPELYLLQ